MRNQATWQKDVAQRGANRPPKQRSCGGNPTAARGCWAVRLIDGLGVFISLQGRAICLDDFLAHLETGNLGLFSPCGAVGAKTLRATQ